MANSEARPPASVTLPAPKLTLPVKIAYGMGDLGAGMTSQFLAFFLLIFLTKEAKMPPDIAGAVLAVGKIWDAVNDPLVGMLSDRTRTRWGRRYPWMFLTAIPFGLSYCLIWLVPFGPDQVWLSFAYYVVITTIFQVFFTTTNLPYTTLTAEMTQNYDERTALTSFRLASSVGGGVFILLANAISGQFFTDEKQRYLVLGAIAGFFVIVTIFICIFGTFGYTESKAKAAGRSMNATAEETEEQITFLQQLKMVLRNRPFLYVIGIYLCSWLALQITATVIPFYGEYWMNIDGGIIALIVQGTAIVMMFVCAALSKRIGKRNLYFLGAGSWILIQIALFFLQPGQMSFLFVLSALAGFGVATAYVVPWSILPDVIELDELNTGRRREGMFYSFMTLAQKFGLAIGIYLVGLALKFSQFDETQIAQPESALTAIRFFMGPVPLVLLVAGVVLVYFYPITKEFHAEVMLRLAERKRSQQQKNGEGQ